MNSRNFSLLVLSIAIFGTLLTTSILNTNAHSKTTLCNSATKIPAATLTGDPVDGGFPRPNIVMTGDPVDGGFPQTTIILTGDPFDGGFPQVCKLQV